MAMHEETHQKGLGQQLLDTMEEVITLMEHTKDLDRLKELSALRKALSKQAGQLIEAHLDSSSAEYKAATAGLQKASDKVRRAIKGLGSIKNAIKAGAQALDLVGKLMP